MRKIIALVLVLLMPAVAVATPQGPGIGDGKPGATQSRIDLLGTHWEFSYSFPGIGTVKYVVSFLKKGKLRHTHPTDKTVGNDNWNQHGNTVTLSFENGYSTLTGKLVSANRIEGTARNVRGQTWNWTAVRLGRK